MCQGSVPTIVHVFGMIPIVWAESICSNMRRCCSEVMLSSLHGLDLQETYGDLLLVDKPSLGFLKVLVNSSELSAIDFPG